ncbi:autophagocytosis protein [Halteromyces radiatus]|uniref:autophagocytosis protein n=1 Tax=Halteromyces radiatus TaxID=101107 RepID=UPI0022207F14|nr:autophagocytosis protein [Halteromyces radiatus]KAI8081594.1 autophagocytosis protein [Halteromyces radiatus]
MAQDLYNNIYSRFHSVREYLAPILKDSKFKETGCLTPEEFVAAGEFLVYKCPTWSWESGLKEKQRDYLPSDKQFLVTRNVPCLRRAKQMEFTDNDDQDTKMIQTEDEGEEDAWTYTHSSRVTQTMDEMAQHILDDEELEEEARRHMASLKVDDNNAQQPALEDIPDIDDIPDMEDDQVEEEEDPAIATQAHDDTNNDKILQVRTYDVFITYDKYYQTPRIWIFGYDEQRRPLTSQQVFEDVNQDYVKKTVTIEPHPHLNLNLASIHPCKHAEVMKKIIERLGNGVSAGLTEQGEEIRVDQYLVIFLKFISSVVPTIDYDHTISA